MKAIFQGPVFHRFVVPVLFLILGCVLLVSLHTDENIDWSRNNHPATWPQLMTFGLMLVAGAMFLWGIHDTWKGKRNGGGGEVADASNDDSIMTAKDADIIASEGVSNVHHHNGLMVLGIAGIFAYGFGVSYMGFAFATLAIIAYWLLIWGVRSPLKIILTSGLGTVSLLFVFIKWAYLPLPKGNWFFDDLTVGLYRLLGLF